MDESISSEQDEIEDDVDIESEVDVYPIEDSENVSDDDKAWGINKAAFYHGDVHSSDDLEKEEIDFTQFRIFSTFNEDDFQSPWLDSFKATESLQLTQNVHDGHPDMQKIICSFTHGVNQLSNCGLHLVNDKFSPESRLHLQTKLHFLFCYCLNVLFYLWLHAKSFNDTHDHPVLKQMLLFDKFLKNMGKMDDLKVSCLPSGTSDESVSDGLDKEHFQESHRKRSITFQMARNKGLIPKRKKEQRNPRVKHRNKYKKALMKRRSQHLSVVQELQKYGGEFSGIRSKVTRSVQIK